MENNQTESIQKYYWGIGLENESYLQFENHLAVSGQFILDKMGRERYSIDYLKCYKPGILKSTLQAAYEADKKYWVSQMLNSHSLEKIDVNYEHKTILSSPPLKDNPNYSGQSILELFLESQPHEIKSMLTQKDNPMGCIVFDGDTIEFVTKYFENRIVIEACNELKASKKIFLNAINASNIFSDKIIFPEYNFGINMFMSNKKNLVLFNNGTYHFHLTLPTLTEDSKIVDYSSFEKAHTNAMYLLQWFEPLFITTLGSPDIMAVISEKYNLPNKFAGGSMRNAMSRYTGIGTYHASMPKGKVLTYPVEEFRKLLPFSKEDNIWWRDQIQNSLGYELLSDLGLDFNREKMYQSGFEFRSFDEFPANDLNSVLHAIILICEHAQSISNVPWSHLNKTWNNIVFRSLVKGYTCEITQEEKLEIIEVLQLNNLQINENSNSLSEFYFQLIQALHLLYMDNSLYVKSLIGFYPEAPPTWNNFNEFQHQQHLNQIKALA